MNPSPEKSGLPPMRCMEIRGGNRAIEEAFQTPGFDAWAYSLPYENSVSGGDLHYVSVCGAGLITRLIVADVSGHGEEVADFSESLHSLMWKNINTKSQTRLVEALNRQFGMRAQSLRFATAVVATYLASNRTLTVCNAGHPRPLWHHADSGEWGLLAQEVAGKCNLPLGLDDDSPYHQFTVLLAPGDVLLFYTDALTEAMDRDGRVLGEEGLLAIARSIDLSEPHRIAPTLIEAVGRHRSGRPADDDLTLIILFHNGRGPRRWSLASRLDVYAKLLGIRGSKPVPRPDAG